MNRKFAPFAITILLIAACIALIAACDEPKDKITLKRSQSCEYQIEIYPLKYKSHDYLYFETNCRTPYGIVHDPDCITCTMK